MTDPHDLDDLASAHLDGATSPEEAARVDADPALRARVEELRQVRAALGDLPAVDEARRELAIAAALAAFDDDVADGDPAGPVAPVRPLAPRVGASPTLVRALSAAAVVAILALLVPLLMSGGGDDDQASFDSTGDAIAGADGGAEAAEDSASTTTGESPTVGSLEQFSDLEQLASAVASGEAPLSRSAVAPQESEGAGTDGGVAGYCPPAGADVVRGFFTVGGVAVEVQLRTEPDGTRVLSVYESDSCALLEQRELP